MSKKRISASDLATSIYKSLCNGFGVQPSKEDEQEVKSVFGTLFGDTPVEVNSYVDDDGSTVTVASVNMCNKSEDKCQCSSSEDKCQCTSSEDKCQCTSSEDKCKCTDSSSETQYSTPAIAASKDLVERMYGISHCTKAQTIDELPKEKNKMSLRDRIFADHRVALQRVEDEKRQAYEQYLVDLITEKLENDEFEYLTETYNGTSAGVLVEIDECPTSAIVINVARVLKADQEWSRIEYMQQNNKTFLKFYF